MRLCGVDGTSLELIHDEGSKRDAYLGRIIKGRYQVIKKLGEGGMGTVYLAEQISMARKVALKVLHGNFASDDEFIGRFRREARLAASLNHPYIITVHDFDQGDDGALFIAMEYIDGRSLTEVIRRDGPLDISRASKLGAQIAEGLEAAHRRGVIHRDIKPDNIMVVGDEDFEKVKLMDFGIARLRDTGSTSRLTRAGVIMGTPAYMAPEQAEGAEVSEQTDLYALGIVLYEMLSGSVPFRASTPGAVLVKQIQERPLALRNLRREIPVAIESAVMQALEKDPNKRQRDMRELAQALRRLERPALNQSMPSTMIGEQATMIDEAPRTMAVTQILRSGLGGKPGFNGKYLTIGLVAAVLIGALIFALLPASKLPLNVAPGESKIKISDEAARPAAVATPVTMQREVPPSGPVAAAKEPIQKPVVTNASSDDLAIQSLIKRAKSLRERGQYADARRELEKASAIAPGNAAVRAEIENVRKACKTEREVLGQSGLDCG